MPSCWSKFGPTLRTREIPEASAPGTSGHGYVAVGGMEPHFVAVLFSEDDQGQWDLSAAGCTALLARLRTRALPPPTTTADLLGALA